jgi:putative ABC transport system ATP-binding protein
VVSGPSGSGKSTFLRLLAGLDRPSGGQIEVSGVQIHRASGRALRRLRARTVGYLFQRPSDNLIPHLTIGEHLALAPGGRRGDDGVSVLERLGVSHRADHLPGELSGGEQHRAALAVLLASGRRIVLADEPTAALDTESAGRLMELLRGAADQGVTFVIASHDPIVRAAADHTVELSHGNLVLEGKVGHPSASYGGGGAPPQVADQVEAAPGRSGRMVLELDGVRKNYRRGPVTVRAVRGASLAVRSGELVGLVGRSGSGKTTVLNLSAGWEEPDGGIIRRPGGRVPAWNEVAVVSQKLGLFDELTIRENAEYPARLAGILDASRERIDELIEALGLREVEDRHPRETSIGEQQRCAIARALVLTPALLLADEPVGHQDDRQAKAALDAIGLAAADGTGALVATHGEYALRFVDRVLPIADGIVPPAP